MNIASASLPAPDSPVTSTLASVAATRSARPTASRIASDTATISITIPLSAAAKTERNLKNWPAIAPSLTVGLLPDAPAKHQNALLRATTVQDRKSAGPSRQRHG